MKLCCLWQEKNQVLLKIKNSTTLMINLKHIIITKFLLTRAKFMREQHFKQSGFTHSVCGLFTKNRQRIQKPRETSDLKDLYRNELDKPCFAYDAAYSDSKDIVKRTISDKILKR